MSDILWGIAQLVNNPSTTIINTIHKHIFRKESNNEAITISSVTKTTQKQDGHDCNINNVLSKAQDIAKSSPEPSSSSKPPEDKQTQVGTGMRKRRQLSTQCSELLNLPKRSSKATSVPKVNHSDRNIGTSNVCLKKNASTETDRFTICEEHQRAIAVLQNWSPFKASLEAQKEPTNKVTILKQKLVVALKCLKLEKIQSIPQHRSPDTEVMKLYKSASVDETTK